MKNIFIKVATLSAVAVAVCFAVTNAEINTNVVLINTPESVATAVASSTPAQAALLVPVVASTCPAVVGFMKLGAANKPTEVAKMQSFLKGQGLEAAVTGIFDQQTEDAVRAFQRAHMNEVMAPWGATRPSGIVYITTAKIANRIACGAPLTLDPTEVSVIASYRQAAAAAESQQAAVEATGSDVTQNSAFMDQAAAAADAANPSIFGRFMRFLRNAF